ncbi:tRNA-specific 2-thiouridylase MnmA [endosymbiont of Euscepes postfasciatus]|uniref:tRNA 2-thiouridine(34) synthase MnmA n=1 Tax=endosymbiont of Euscepes postfasciatus TaxID=650377 RepID=UPI000DC71FD3|nr:tRNA 2-thiouridine(34) synthase MnmA [endosymbiont of Euscepes postfasciatus]BBA84632.1 tRNA-specific 2-thiouridylase MnmA [endosymbiont of Euscepes postfasciatus]
MCKKVLIAMSGGVDSSVSAYLLKQKYIVEAIFINNWNFNICNNSKDLLDVINITNNILKIKLHILDFSKEFWEKVFIKTIKEYKKGKTPNPDILCNKYVKFNKLIKFMKSIKFDYISTGHYVKLKFINNKYFLKKSKDLYQDQSYFLYSLNQKILKYCIFPLGDMTKYNVRKLAKKNKLFNYNKPSSTGICFINNKNFKKFISKYIEKKYGKILTLDNKYIGNHDGHYYYTIGQRKGLNLGGIKNYNSKPWYIIKKDCKKNILYVSQNKNLNFLYKGLIVKNIDWIFFKSNFLSIKITAKIRYSINCISCKLYIINKNYLIIIFDNLNGIVVPGQSVVFYINNYCIGGGIIHKEIL